MDVRWNQVLSVIGQNHSQGQTFFTILFNTLARSPSFPRRTSMCGTNTSPSTWPYKCYVEQVNEIRHLKVKF